ncbi:MAG TPA: toll/interleukin-1 receptor domain-containing protein, partial [Ilumatobacteraceae bacterium]|nr:toll/interleukin-1 receptor domain-containing protein [Ilumatobacteraceae bacterium]
HGGQIWWDEILRQVRDCEVFVLAVSLHSLASEACLAEWEYAEATKRPVLPIRIADIDMTNAPERLRNTQHIDFHAEHAPSVIALAKALNSLPEVVPLPEPLPPPPPTPQSYRDRYAALLGSAPLTMDEQMNYFIRLTVDIESANSEEALELLRALHERDDLSWKVRQRIDRFLTDRRDAAAVSESPNDDGGGSETTSIGAAEVEASDVGGSEPHPKRKRLWWAVGAGAAALVIAVMVAVLWPDSKPAPPAQLPENATCDVDTCSDTPIRVFVDLDDAPDEITTTLTDPYGHLLDRVDPPTERVDGGGLEWTWSANYEDPIGTYVVNFAGTNGEPIEQSFTIEPSTGPWGVVQRAAEAISNQDWDTAAEIDSRIADELERSGALFLEDEYPADDEKHWYPNDASGKSNDVTTTIIGAYVTYSERTNETKAYCELWTVRLNGMTMRSDPLPLDGQQQSVSITDHLIPSDFSDFVSGACTEAASGS